MDNIEKRIFVKWAAPNTPMIKTYAGDRFVLTKRELLALEQEIKEFLEFYREHFSDNVIDNTDGWLE